ncbi:beta-ketoacyl synthase N-terminal-like domain-containing protein [Candidatus Profftella armatura]
MSSKNAIFMDPQFRKLLEHSWKAVEDSGYISSQNSRNSSFYVS